MTFTSANASNLSNLIPFASNEIEIINIIRQCIAYFDLNRTQGNEARALEFKIVAIMANKKMTAINPSSAAHWLKEIRNMVYPENFLPE